MKVKKSYSFYDFYERNDKIMENFDKKELSTNLMRIVKGSIISIIITLLLLFISGMLMNKNKWFGCFLGIIIGIILIYMGTQETGQIIKETPFGIILCLYYIVCGIITYKNSDF